MSGAHGFNFHTSLSFVKTDDFTNERDLGVYERKILK